MLRLKSSALIRMAVVLVPSALAAAAASCGDDDEPADDTDDAGTTIRDGTLGGSDGSIAQATSNRLPDPWQFDRVNSFRESGTSLPDNVPELFGADASSSAQPEWSYPLDGSLHPSNLPHIEFHWWKAVRENTVFRVNALVAGDDFHFYFECDTPACAEPVPKSEWLYLGLEYPGEPMQLTVEETDLAGSVLYRSNPITITFSPEPVLGALYYWAAADWSIKRANFGAAEAVPFIMPHTATNEFECAACHSVSRDGTTIAFAVSDYDGESVAAIQTAPTTDPANPYVRPTPGQTPFTNPDLTHEGTVTTGPTDYFGHNVALSPDGSVAAINGVDVDSPNNWPPWFELRDTRTGATLDKVYLGSSPFPADSMPILPEFSPDGTKIVATLTNTAGQCAWTYATCSGGLVVLDVTNNQIGTPQPLVDAPAGTFHYYPTWSPGGDYVAFVSASGGAPDNKSDEIHTGALYIVPFDGATHTCPGDCVQLTNAMHVDPSTGPHTTWPKFAPFAQGENGHIVFLAFTSRMNFGVRPNPDRSQIWMAAIDLDLLPGDPSFAPVWLPYQESSDQSLTPYWAETLPCNSPEAGVCEGCTQHETCYVDNVLNICECMAAIPE